MRIQWFLSLASAVVVLVCATPIPSPTNGGTNTNNQNLSRATTPPLSSSPSIVDKQSHNNLKPLKEVILTQAQRTKIQSWEEEMEKWNPSNLQKHDEAIASLKEQARHEGKDPNNVVDAYRLRKMNISHYRQLVKNLEPGSLVRGRPRTEIDPRIIAEWEAEMEKKKKKVWERYMNGKEKVERENEGDGGKAVVRYQNERYRVSQADARHRQKKKDWMKDVGGETNAPAPATHTLNEHHHHSEDEEEGDEGRRMSFSFQSDTD